MTTLPDSLVEDLDALLSDLAASPIECQPCDHSSDYRCRYCGARTRTNQDWQVDHYEGCELKRISDLRSRLSDVADQ